MSNRLPFAAILFSAITLAVATPIGAATDEVGLLDPETKKAVLFYQNKLFDSPTGVYEGDGWTFFQTRVPFEKSAKSRQAAQQTARLTHDRLLLRWMIDRSIDKGGPEARPALSPGAALIRDLVREENPAWEFDSVKLPPVDLHQLADQAEHNVFIVASGCKTEKLLAAVPEKLGTPWPTARWAAAAKDAIRLRYRAAPEAFLATAGAIDLLDVRRTATQGVFPAIDSKTFPLELASFVKSNAAGGNGRVEEEAGAYSIALAEYVASSATAIRIRERALALQKGESVRSQVFSTPIIVEETNRVTTIETNWIARATISSNRTVRTLANGRHLRGSVPYRAAVFVERTSEPAFTVKTNETITIVRRTEASLENICVFETGRPQFERLFLSAGTLPNAAAPQTEWGDSARAAFYNEKVPENLKEAALMDALGENPGDKILWNLLGRVFQERKDWFGAAICFRNALRLDPEFDYALTNLAICHKTLGNLNLAVGTAVLARGLATNDWCEKRAAAILESPMEAFKKP